MNERNPISYIQGNLALNMPAQELVPEERGRFVVVEGSLGRSVPSPAPRSRLIQAAAFLAIACFIIIAVLGPLASERVARDAAIAGIRLERVTVESGDTLWDLARAHAVSGLSDADMVDYLVRANHLDSQSVLRPGQEVLVARAS